MVRIECGKGTTVIDIEGTGEEILRETVNGLAALAKEFDKEGGESQGTIFAAGLYVSLGLIWSKRHDFNKYVEEARKTIRIVDGDGKLMTAENAGVRA